MKYDVIIVGAGPAGSLAGINLADSGVRVLIVDRATFPRTKPCGGGISYRVYDRFPYLQQVLRQIPTNVVNRVYLESPCGESVETEDQASPLYAMIRRYEFDAALLAECKRRGIDVVESCTVTKLVVNPNGVALTTSEDQVLNSELIIGADGANSIVAVHSGLRGAWDKNHVAIDTTEETDNRKLGSHRKDTMFVYYGYGNGYGYGYVFPKLDHINLGVGYLLSYFQEKVRIEPYEKHLLFIEDLKRRQVVCGKSEPSNFSAFLIPVGGPLKHVSSDRVMLVGDAGGFVNGFTAEGIYYAMVSGEHAARVAAEAVKTRDYSRSFLRRYDEMCDREIGQELKKSVTIQKFLLHNPKRVDKLVMAAKRNSGLKSLFTEYAVGKLSYGQFKRRVIPTAIGFYLLHKIGRLVERVRSG